MKLWIWMLEKANHKDFKNGIKRGQFITSINEMREAMSWMVGYRKMTPTKDHIRGCYETFNEARMTTTMKTTRGMVVTILNYSEYQTPKNYETHNEKATNPPVTPHDIQEGKESNNNNIVCSFLLTDGSEYQAENSYVEEMQKIYPGVDFKYQFKKMKGWCKSNPSKRKTKRGSKKFINNWLSGAQDEANKSKPDSDYTPPHFFTANE